MVRVVSLACASIPFKHQLPVEKKIKKLRRQSYNYGHLSKTIFFILIHDILPEAPRSQWQWMYMIFSFHFYKGNNLKAYCFLSHIPSLSKKGFTLQGKSLLPVSTNSFLKYSPKIYFQEMVTLENKASSEFLLETGPNRTTL